ncbi:MAG: hypothetical protein WBA05_17975 [Gordonia sp. (in: high G+C Gram-positive bacteria)]|uniref:hypothetical protein n=1 Tax=Gordonia sp. (in: high G+C Gram-positive bacteria) TaxID=84139 RepID=UPI003C78A8F1
MARELAALARERGDHDAAARFEATARRIQSPRAQLLRQLSDAIKTVDFDALDEADLILLVGIFGNRGEQ